MRLPPLVALCLSGFLVPGYAATADNPSRTYHSELEYFKTVIRSGPVGDPQIVGLLLVQFLNANQLTDGMEFFEALLQKLTVNRPVQEKSLYLAALGALRASYADQVFLLRRMSWVNQTIDLMEQARQMSKNENFLEAGLKLKEKY